MQAQFDEIVIFQESHILPFAMVALRESPLPSSPSSTSGIVAGWKAKPTIEWTPEDVSEWMSTLHLSKEYPFIFNRIKSLNTRDLFFFPKNIIYLTTTQVTRRKWWIIILEEQHYWS